MVSRVDQWERVLSSHLEAKAKAPFEWGVNDCMGSVAQYFEKMTGQEGKIWPQFAGYKTEKQAVKLIAKHGGIVAIIDRFAGPNHSAQRRAQRGDIVVVMMPDLMAGIVDDTGQRVAVVTEKGLIRIPVKRAIRIWSF